MIVNYLTDYFGHGPEIYLGAQNDQDRELLERIERECVTRGCGRVGDDLRMHHVRIALTPAQGHTNEDNPPTNERR